MAEAAAALSVSFRQDTGSIEHNNRIFVTDNVDSSRTPDNIIYVQRDLRELYHETFDEALEKYNSAQTRKDRKISDYYDHIRKGKKEKLFQEVVVTFGNSETCPLGSENWDLAIKLLDEYARNFERRYPQFKVANMVMHLDESCPHLHIDFVPVCYGQEQGLETRVSMKRAIQQMMNISPNKKKECEVITWANAEREEMTKILNAHDMKRRVVGAYHEHQPLKEYKAYINDLKTRNAQINTLLAQNPADLTSVEVGEIINQNKLLRESLTKQGEDLKRYKNQATSNFVPLEIYNDERRQYIMATLRKNNLPFVEDEHAIYIQECYEQSLKKIAAEYKPNRNPGVREQLKFTLDRLVYAAVDFENMLGLLEQMGCEVKRGKYTAVKPPYAQRFMRLKTLGADYTEIALKERIEQGKKYTNTARKLSETGSEIEKPFYSTISETVTVVSTFAYTPEKVRKNEPYSFENDVKINKLSLALTTLNDYNIASRERLYGVADKLRESIENSADETERLDLKMQYARIESVIRLYEEIVEGNYIDNLIRSEREKRAAEERAAEEQKAKQDKKIAPPAPDKAQENTQAVNRKPKKHGR